MPMLPHGLAVQSDIRCQQHAGQTGSFANGPRRGMTMKPLTPMLSLFIFVFGVTTAAAQMYQDESGRWLNSEGGNIYGDSNYNLDADPNYNLDADPNYNLDADPNSHLDADPDYSLDGDPRYRR